MTNVVPPLAISDAPELLTGGNAEWRQLTLADGVSDELKAQVQSAEAALQDELSQIINSEHLIVLAGLGTSIGVTAGSDATKMAPSMKDLWAGVSQLESFEKVKPSLSPELLAEQNFEHLLSEAQARSALAPNSEDLSVFIRDAEKLVLDRCSFVDDGSTLAGHETFLRKVARRSTRLQRSQLFTTNYDLAFETAARRARFNVIDGFGYGGSSFDGSSFDLDFVRRRPNEAPTLEPNVFHLLKLHGSVDWDQSDSQVRKVTDQPDAPVLIYPSATKYQLSYQQPYLEFMSRFQIALRQPDVGLIVVGFGFNDDHIVAPIQAALRSNIGLRVIVVSPGVRDDKRASTINDIEALIGLGDRRLSILKGTFADLVRYLPELPPLEERSAHVDRFERRAGEVRR